ncbi:MAG TPA: hypothetical protein DCW31_08100, partial [Lactobacillus sp.]|nr:hypothetical protein [Lactobacillus sp.]
LGADGLETDVQETADHQLVLCHDDRVERTTNGTGKISQLTLAQIQQLDAGCQFYGHSTTVKMPTLNLLLRQLRRRRFSGILNIELKAQSRDHQHVVVALVHQLLLFPDLASKVVVSSFSVALLSAFRSEISQRDAPAIKTALLIRWRVHRAQQLLGQRKITGVHPKWWLLFLHYHWLINHCSQLRFWTVNRLPLIKWCFEHDVAAIITDEVELALLFQKMQQQKQRNFMA